MEYLDVTDETGQPTGEFKERSAVHRDGDWHKAVHVWIVNVRNEILIQRRADTKESSPGLWDVSMAGHLSAGETVLEAAIKEAREELGQSFRREDFEYLFTVNQKSVHQNGRYLDNEVNEVFLVRADIPLDAFVVQPEEVAEVRYLTLDDLEQSVRSSDLNFVPHPEAYALLFAAVEKRL